jgi:hypothetical protein
MKFTLRHAPFMFTLHTFILYTTGNNLQIELFVSTLQKCYRTFAVFLNHLLCVSFEVNTGVSKALFLVIFSWNCKWIKAIGRMNCCRTISEDWK